MKFYIIKTIVIVALLWGREERGGERRRREGGEGKEGRAGQGGKGREKNKWSDEFKWGKKMGVSAYKSPRFTPLFQETSRL